MVRGAGLCDPCRLSTLKEDWVQRDGIMLVAVADDGRRRKE